MLKFALVVALLSLSLPACVHAQTVEPATGSSGTSETGASTDYQQPLVITLADLLNIYSGIVTAHMSAVVANDEDVKTVEVALLTKSGKTVVDVVFTASSVAEYQGDPPGSQTRDLLEWHRRLAEGLQGHGLLNSDRYEGIESYPTAASAAVSRFLRGRAMEDIVIVVRFRQDGETHIYAEVTHDGVDFNPDAPSARK